MILRTAVKILTFVCSEQEGEPNRIILREISTVRLERVVKKCGLIVFRLRRSRKNIFSERKSPNYSVSNYFCSISC